MVTISYLSIDNTPATFLRKGESLPGQPAIGTQVQAALTTSFLVLIGIFFPSVTGKWLVHCRLFYVLCL